MPSLWRKRQIEEHMSDSKNISVLCAELRAIGCAVVCFTPQELRGADPDHVEDRLVEIGWDVIDSLAVESGDE
jgi:hypothetical protein